MVLGLLDRCRFGVVHQLSTSLAATSAFVQLTDLTTYRGRPPLSLGGEDFPGPSAANRFYPTTDGYVRVQVPGDVDLDAVATFTTRSTVAALEWCAANGVPAVPARTPNEVCADEYLHDHGLMRHRVTRSGVAYTQPDQLARFSRTPPLPNPDAPGLGQHTEALLGQIGYSPEQIRALASDGVVVIGGPLDLQFSPLYR
ncbi:MULTISPECIES: CoA transferase [unclassified Pseudofrankia]|uniref:CoA transferase n=1 Tax=unclassified Pseudofrankia TaxID=2994372 RepID=UPI0008DA8F37|nr:MULTISPECIES: CoA transferase [unclassified Pseudofrankia]MDT3446337.1 CoA transferase [Pseudofrankia sp. BMG5.37]OHV56743.1 hypothetical protein BCD48_43625 [Pseudofrankia sp. BMG5.36]